MQTVAELNAGDSTQEDVETLLLICQTGFCISRLSLVQLNCFNCIFRHLNLELLIAISSFK